MKNLSLLLLTGCVAGSLFAQPGGVPAGSATNVSGTITQQKGKKTLRIKGSATNVSGTITQFNFGREGEPIGFLLGSTLVQVRGGGLVLSSFAVGDFVQVAGYGLTTDTGVQRVDATSVVNATRSITISIPQPGSETAYSGSDRVAQFNYGKRGEINGLILGDGTIVKTPPHLGSTIASLAPIGSHVNVTGLARRTLIGKTVVDAYTINGQTVRGLPPSGPGRP
jgi:hypothetical protein